MMRIILSKNSNSGIFEKGVPLGDTMISRLKGEVVISGEEKERVIAFCDEVWQKVMERTGVSFIGHVRFDLVPSFTKNEISKGEINLGEVGVRSIYEVNTEDPECAAACSAVYPENPLPAIKLARVIKENFGEKVDMMIGDGIVKKEWGQAFFRDLREELDLKVVENNKDSSSSVPLWRWGGVRWNEYSEFPLAIQEYLLDEQKNGKIFNTVYSAEEKNPGDKRHLMEMGISQGVPLTEKEFIYTNKNSLVIKPYKGTSGKGIVFGEKVSSLDWKKTVEELDEKSYGVFWVSWLPQINTPAGSVGIDFNPSFFAIQKKLFYLYTIVRIDRWKIYRERGMQNLSRGAAFCGAIMEE